MKKYLLTVFVSLISIFILVGVASAQDEPTTESKPKKDQPYVPSTHIRGGVVIGINACQIDGDDYAGYHKVGLNAGFYGDIPISKIFFASTEILYSLKGAYNPVYPNMPVREMYKWNIHYVEIPVLFHFQDKRAFNVGAGFSYSRMVGEQLYAEGEPQPPVQICSGKPTNTDLLNLSFVCLRKNDYAVVAEANYFPLKHLALNVRFAYSMAPMGYFGSSNFVNRGMYFNMLTFRAMWIFGS